MVDGKRLLDALMGAVSQKGSGTAAGGQGGGFLDQAMQTLGPALGQILGGGGGAQPPAPGSASGVPRTGGLREAPPAAQGSAGPSGDPLRDVLGQFTGGQGAGDLAAKAKDFMARNPGLAEAAALSAAGLLFGTKGGRGVAGSLVKYGGLAVIGSLAYKAFQKFQGGQEPGADEPAAVPPPVPQSQLPPPAPAPKGDRSPLRGGGVSAASFDPAQTSDSDAVRLARAMVAAANADGHIDDGERQRITAGLSQAGFDGEVAAWFDKELARPASVADLARGVASPEQAAQVYAAARVAIEPDTAEERDFLTRLADALDLDPALKRHLDEAASSIKA